MISLYKLYSIPFYINIGQTNDFSNSAYGFFKFLYYLIIFVIIISLAFLFTKYVAKKGLGNRNNKNIKVIESVSLGVDKSLLLIKVGEQYFLIGSAQKNIVFLSEVKSEAISIPEYSINDMNAENKFDNYMAHFRDDSAMQDALKYNNIADSLRKLKNMVRGSKSDEK